MQDILPDIVRWHALKQPVALATVVETFGSSPRTVGAKMALSQTGEMAGSVSGGCIESAVVEAGRKVLQTGTPQLLHFGVADDDAWNVGLACGGQIDVFIRPVDWSLFVHLKKIIDQAQPAAYITVIRGPDSVLGRELVVLESGQIHGSIQEKIDEAVKARISKIFSEGRTQRIILPLESDPTLEIFADILLPSPTLIIVGGVHIAMALVSLAKTMGYRTIVVDPRRFFGSTARFPNVDILLHDWPDEALAKVGITSSSAVVMLTHDPKIDDSALMASIPSPAFYLGALGSRKTHAARRKRLFDAGFSEDQVNRLHGPIGIDIHARTPEEIALAIMAEIVLERNR